MVSGCSAMLRLSKLADYAVVVLIRLDEGGRAGCPASVGVASADAVQTAACIAAATGVPEPTVAKVLKALSGAALVESQRGAKGGYRLRRPLRGIAVSDVIAAIDGPIALTACVDGSSGGCDVQSLCAVRGRWDLVNQAIRAALSDITLHDMRIASVPPAFRALPDAADRASGSAAPSHSHRAASIVTTPPAE
jgi:FeS assembly SUF system regulator